MGGPGRPVTPTAPHTRSRARGGAVYNRVIDRLFLARLLVAVLFLMAVVGSVFVPLRADATVLTFNATKDSYLNQYYHTTNESGLTYMLLQDLGATNEACRGILSFDLSAEGNATVSSAVVLLHYSYDGYRGGAHDATGKEMAVCKVTKGNWTNAGVTWDKYNGTNAWASGGGDYVTTSPACGTFTVPAEYGWVPVDITGIVQDAIDTGNGSVDLLVKFDSESVGSSWSSIKLDSLESGYAPYLSVTFGSSAPYGETTGATDITAHSATINAHCVTSGGVGNCSAVFMWGSLMQDGNQTYGNVASGEDFSIGLTGLIPNSEYGYWVVFTNEVGSYWTTPVELFDTLTTTEVEAPYVVTDVTTDIGNTSAVLHGRIAYDGNLDCFVGFQYRVSGSGTWINGWNDMYETHNWEPWRTGDSFSASLSNLLVNTSYEVRAQAKNTLGTGYGTVKVFTTSYSMYAQPTPTAGPGGGGIVPPVNLPFHLNANVKLILALVTTIGGMLVIGILMGQHGGGNTAGVVILAYGLACVVGFSVYGFYPFYVLYLIGGIVALGLLLTLAGRGGSKAQ